MTNKYKFTALKSGIACINIENSTQNMTSIAVPIHIKHFRALSNVHSTLKYRENRGVGTCGKGESEKEEKRCGLHAMEHRISTILCN